MTPRRLYLGLCLVGTALPYAALLALVCAQGLDLRLLYEHVFGDAATAFFALDVVVSSVVLWVLVWVEGRRAGMRALWAPVLANLLVGVSLGLPLFLYLRERRLERRA